MGITTIGSGIVGIEVVILAVFVKFLLESEIGGFIANQSGIDSFFNGGFSDLVATLTSPIVFTKKPGTAGLVAMTGVGIIGKFWFIKITLLGAKAIKFKPNPTAISLMSPGHDFLANPAGIGGAIAILVDNRSGAKDFDIAGNLIFHGLDKIIISNIAELFVLGGAILKTGDDLFTFTGGGIVAGVAVALLSQFVFGLFGDRGE